MCLSSPQRVFTLIIQINPSVSLHILNGCLVIGLLLKTGIIFPLLLFLSSPILMKLAKAPAGVFCKITQILPIAENSFIRIYNFRTFDQRAIGQIILIFSNLSEICLHRVGLMGETSKPLQPDFSKHVILTLVIYDEL